MKCKSYSEITVEIRTQLKTVKITSNVFAVRSNQLEQLEFKLKKKYWDLETGRKIENIVILSENVYMQSNFSSRHDISPFLLHSRNNLIGILDLHTLYVFINGKMPPYSPSQSADLHPIFEF